MSHNPNHAAALEAIRARATTDLDTAAAEALTLLALATSPQEALERVELCVELGRASLASAWAQGQLAEHPDWTALHQWLCELSEGDLAPESPQPDPAPAMEPLLEACDADVIRFLHLFSGREDTHARQWVSGDKSGYSPVRQPVTPALVRAHLAGSTTLGVYPLRIDGTATFFALDLDIKRRELEAARGRPERIAALRELVDTAGWAAQAQLASLGLPTLVEDSGHKGRHLWGFFREPLPSDLAHRLAARLCRALQLPDPAITVEGFPKQGAVAQGGIGNLIKLPLGVHRVTGRRGMFLERGAGPLADPWPALRSAPRIGREAVLDALGRIAPAISGALSGAPAHAWPPTANAPAAMFSGGSTGAQTTTFTEADLDRPALAAVFSGCAVLAQLRHKALHERRLSADERMVLVHSLGHVPGGVQAVNYLLDRCPETPLRDRLKSPLRGHPISCPRVRQRVPQITAQVACHCAFEQAAHTYPNPTLHWIEGPAAEQTSEPASANSAAATLSALEDRRARLEQELAAKRDELTALLRAQPDGVLQVPGGRWLLAGEGDLAVAQWEPEAPAEGPLQPSAEPESAP